MTYQFEFNHPTLLSARRVGRAVKFIRDLDDLAANILHPDTPRLSANFSALFNGDADAAKGYEILKQMQENFKKPGFRRTNEAAAHYFICAIQIAYHDAVHSLQANDPDDSSEHMEDAKYMLGHVHCLIQQVEGPWDYSWQARKGAAVTNSIYNATKESVFRWCEENRAKFDSLHKASIVVSSKEGIDPRTAKKYIKEWESKQ